MKPGIVITCHNHWEEYGRPCVESVFKYTPKPNTIIVFDNESEPSIPAQPWGIHLVRISDQNAFGGLTGTWNEGLLYCLACFCDRVVLLNHDTVVDETWPGYLQKFENHPDAVIGPVSNNPGANKYQKADGPMRGTMSYREVNGFCFGAMISVFQNNMYDERHFFDPKYPFARNENEWCKRHVAKGGRCLVDQSTYVFHHKAAEWRTKFKNELPKWRNRWNETGS